MNDGIEWLADHEEDGEVCFRIGRRGPEVVAEWLGLALLVAHRDGSNVRLSFAEDADPRDVEKIRRGSAWLLERHLQGRISLHGSAVAVRGRAIVFLGRSGAGKSTAAAAACAKGAELLADDAVALDFDAPTQRWMVQPRERDHWLDHDARIALGRPSSGDAKEPIRASRASQQPVPLALFVELAFGEGEEPKVSRLHGVGALASLVPQVARFILDEPGRQRRELDLLHAIVDTAPVFLLERPRRMERLAMSADRVFDLLGAPDERLR